MLREPWVAAILSLMLPGLGHLYAGRALRGLAFLCAVAVSVFLILAYAFQPSTRIGLPLIGTALGFVIALRLYITIDAYRSTKVWNLQRNAAKPPAWRRGLQIAAATLLLLLLRPDALIARYAANYVLHNVAQAYVIPTDAMAPALLTHDRILVDKRIYRSREPRRGDVVVFGHPMNSGHLLVKRIVGLPGERIELVDGAILINRRSLTDAYAVPSGDIRGCLGEYGPAVIPVDSVFALGDNWCASEDSRYFASIPRRSVVGKVTKIYYPFNRSGPVQ